MKLSFAFPLALCAAGLLCRAQSPDAALPAFEVASVHPAATNELNGMYTYPGGRVRCNGCQPYYLLMNAFDVQRYQLSGPLGDDFGRYDIEAKPPASSQASHFIPPYPKFPPNDELRQMLQSLLVERFQLKYHRDVKEGPTYLLVRGRGPLHMQDAKNKDDYPWSGGFRGGMIVGDGLSGDNESMPDLAWRLSRYLEKPVTDQTGLAGSYDFKVPYSSDDERPDIVSMILTTVTQLGLKLEPSKGPVETIVIERLEKPSAN